MEQIRRAHPRLLPSIDIKVYENVDELGCVINFSEGGIMVLSERPMTQWKVYRLKIVLTTKEGAPIRGPRLNSDILECTAECRWTKSDDTDKDCYLNGFSIIEIDATTHKVLRSLLQKKYLK